MVPSAVGLVCRPWGEQPLLLRPGQSIGHALSRPSARSPLAAHSDPAPCPETFGPPTLGGTWGLTVR
eukprot:5787740-Alexandrium_andersonii.AAC.1